MNQISQKAPTLQSSSKQQQSLDTPMTGWCNHSVLFEKLIYCVRVQQKANATSTTTTTTTTTATTQIFSYQIGQENQQQQQQQYKRSKSSLPTIVKGTVPLQLRLTDDGRIRRAGCNNRLTKTAVSLVIRDLKWMPDNWIKPPKFNAKCSGQAETFDE
ncbi:hypothetical protein T11_4427 [Trichinella zimbabwensis]|uniref:Uncharacterized protein n=1 Tax=Trichinella zimbabwensis TaxID=268475 RepID=A0A0V1H727_9BILA|nr:hypothetical protein T11_4427 [Trichinella zimbabwensis]